MEDWKRRLVEEHNQLEERYEKLRAFNNKREVKGKFNVDYNNSRIIFDDENGKRHIIYYSVATVVIDEK